MPSGCGSGLTNMNAIYPFAASQYAYDEAEDGASPVLRIQCRPGDSKSPQLVDGMRRRFLGCPLLSFVLLARVCFADVKISLG